MPKYNDLIPYIDPRLLNPSESTSTNTVRHTEKPIESQGSNGMVNVNDTVVSLIPGLGDAMDLINIGQDIADKNYSKAALGLGLLFVPNILEKPIKAVNKTLKNLFKSSNTKNLEKVIKKEVIKNNKLWGGSKKLKFIPSETTKDEVVAVMSPNVKRRFDKQYKEQQTLTPDQAKAISKLNIGIIDYKTGKITPISKDFKDKLKEEIYQDLKDTHPEFRNSTGSSIIWLNHKIQPTILLDSRLSKYLDKLKAVFNHEYGHYLQDVFGADNDVWENIYVDSIDDVIPYAHIDYNKDPEMFELINNSLSPSLLHGSSGREVSANLNAYRIRNNIGGRDLTEEEVKDFLNTDGKEHLTNFIANYGDTNSKEYKQFLNRLKTFLVNSGLIAGGATLLNQQNKENKEK